jgi:hypothetical protein
MPHDRARLWHSHVGRPASREIDMNPASPRPLLSLDAFGWPCHRRQHGQGVGLRAALTGERKARQETCVLRSQTSVAVEHSRSRISTQHHNMYESVTGGRFAKERAFGL